MVALDCLVELCHLVGSAAGNIVTCDGLVDQLPHASPGMLPKLAFALRALIKVCPARSFNVINVLLITINDATMQGQVSAQLDSNLTVIFANSVGLASVLSDSAAVRRHNVAAAIVSCACALIDPEMIEGAVPEALARRRISGFILLEAAMLAGAEALGRD